MEETVTCVSWEVCHLGEPGKEAFPDRTEIGYATPVLRDKDQEKPMGSLKLKHQSRKRAGTTRRRLC